ncbi:MAG: O-antigen ligase family protein [Oscillospiraceae bacterium]|nr:O-antigen ligase family protein [Oscillospiraceae bacterium]
MSKYLTESLIWRLCSAILKWLRSSFLGRGAQALGRSWRQSAIYGFFAKLLGAEPAIEDSAYYRRGTRSNESLHRRGAGFRRAYEESFLARRTLPYLRQSFFFRLLLGNGITGLLLSCAASYAIIDYLLRDVLQMEAIASVWDEGFMLLCGLWLIVRRMGSEKPMRSRRNTMDLLVAMYMLVGVILLVCNLGEEIGIHITGFRASMQYLLMFFLTVRLIRNDGDFMRMYKLLMAIATVLALYGIYQFIIGVEIPAKWTDAAEGSVRTRVFAIFSNPNVMGAYMILFAPMTIGMAYMQKDPATKVFYWFCGICMCVACLFTMSRGAWLALAVSALLFSLIIDRKLFFLLLMGGVVSCFLPFVRSRIGYLFTPAFQESNQRAGRGVRWDRAFGYVRDANAWTMGLGYGMYGGAVAMQNQINHDYIYTYVDNYYVKIIAENGILGVSALLTMVGGLFWNGARACGRNSKSPYKPLCAGMLVGLIGFMIQSFFECLWEEPYLMALFFIIAAMLIYVGFFREEETEVE